MTLRDLVVFEGEQAPIAIIVDISYHLPGHVGVLPIQYRFEKCMASS